MNKTMKLIAVMTSCLMLTNCASQTMQGYIGKPVSEVVMDYGMPIAAIDTGKNEKAFIWSEQETYVVPGHTTTSGNVYGMGNSAFFNAQTYTSPGYVSSNQCNYTFYAKHARKDIEGPAAWTVTGFRKPDFMCE